MHLRAVIWQTSLVRSQIKIRRTRAEDLYICDVDFRGSREMMRQIWWVL